MFCVVYPLSYSMFQGNFLLLAKRPEAAAIAFRAAQNLRSDLRSYQGLVNETDNHFRFCTVLVAINL